MRGCRWRFQAADLALETFPFIPTASEAPPKLFSRDLSERSRAGLEACAWFECVAYLISIAILLKMASTLTSEIY